MHKYQVIRQNMIQGYLGTGTWVYIYTYFKHSVVISLRSCRLWTFFVPMFKVVAKGVNYDWFSIVLWLEGHFQSGWCVYIEGTCLPWLYRLKMWYKLHSAHVNLLYKWSCKIPINLSGNVYHSVLILLIWCITDLVI